MAPVVNINFKGVLNHVTHEQRMGVVVWLILTAMMMGEDVLVHCRQGKHRSAVVCLLIMLIISMPPWCHSDGPRKGRPRSWCHSDGPRS